MKSFSCVRLLATPWTAAYQAPLSMGFSRQEYWSGLPLPCPYYSANINHSTAAKSLQSCPTLCDSTDGSPPGSPSLGFSRQEHSSGLPFPSPAHGSEKWKWSRAVVSDSSRPHGLQPTRLLRPWDFSGRSTGVGCHCLLQWTTIPVWTKCLNLRLLDSLVPI